jgi:hypothetical protein
MSTSRKLHGATWALILKRIEERLLPKVTTPVPRPEQTLVCRRPQARERGAEHDHAGEDYHLSPKSDRICVEETDECGEQGNFLSRFLLVEAAQAGARGHLEWRRRYTHLAMDSIRETESSRLTQVS